MDERFWLLGTSYNTGFECLESARRSPISGVHQLIMTCPFRASMLDEAKRWFESSTIICRFVPGGKERAEKVAGYFLDGFKTLILAPIRHRFQRPTCICWHGIPQVRGDDFFYSFRLFPGAKWSFSTL